MERPKLTGAARILRSMRVTYAGFRDALANEPAIREQLVALVVLVPVAAR